MRHAVLFYCQHVLGMGHFIRSTEIVRGLTDFDVTFLNGGEVVQGFELPPAVEVVNLPPIQSDAEFRTIYGTDEARSLDEIKRARTERILAEFERVQPALLIVELFPFGRRKFAFELLPLLEHIRATGSPTRVVCSLRDILVSKRDQARYEAHVIGLINEYFDLLLIHADPRFQRLEETFGRVADLTCAIRYTGFVAQAAPEPMPAAPRDEAMIVASIGGGRVGYELLACTIAASARLRELPHRVRIFAGPYMSDAEFAQLAALAAPQPQIDLERYTTHFCAELAAADLSISMAGYNTCMNIVTTGVPALVCPFTGNGNEEQTIRAAKLEQLGVVGMLPAEGLTPEHLAAQIRARLAAGRGVRGRPLDIRGVKQTAAELAALLAPITVS